MRRVLTIVLALFFAALSATTGRGFTSAACGFAGRPENPLEERLFADAADGRLGEFSPLGAALVASGVDNADELHRYEQKAKSLADELRRWDESAGPREQVEMVFDFMHDRLLRGGYDLAATDLRVVLDEGRFNCVSATVLFNFFGGELGLKCRGLEMPSHAMSRVLLPEGAIDVETTCPRWFHLAGDSRQQTAAASEDDSASLWCSRLGCQGRRDACTTNSSASQKAREVSPLQLAAMIYYNRGVDLLAEKRFAEAAAANAKSLRLDPDNLTARGNLLATINNWSIDLGDTGHFAESVDLLRQGLAIDRNFDAFAQNYVHVHHQWVEHLCGEGRFEEALAILSRATAEMPDRDYLRREESDVRQRCVKAIASTPQGGPLLEWPCGGRTKSVD
jgi:tetratricopeptide (TPR) repeat protein